MGEVHRGQEPVTSPTNGLTSDVLRARAVEYYNNYLPHTPRSTPGPSLSFPLHKSGSVTQLNAVPSSSGKMAPSNGIVSGKNGVLRERPTVVKNGIYCNYSPHPRGERPHRTHSERSSRLFHPTVVISGEVSHSRNATPPTVASVSSKLGLYRSNSSLDLDHEDLVDERVLALKREYGSASSLDVISTTGDSFFAMLKKFHSDNPDQRSPGPARMNEYLRGPIDPGPSTQNASNALTHGTAEGLEDSQSPKTKNKFQKLWEIKDKGGKVKARIIGGGEPSIFRKFRGNKSDSVTITTEHRGSDNSLDAENRLEEKLRKKAFAHYDYQSLTANLSLASKLCDILRERRNTTTGASAASALGKTPSGSVENLNEAGGDNGDGRSNDLLLSCRCFRNELGGEEERLISLNKLTVKRQRFLDDPSKSMIPVHRPPMACGLSILENANGARWKQRPCPYQRPTQTVERVDVGALYYRKFFFEQEHQNWFGTDDAIGPLAISVKREKVDEPSNAANGGGANTNNSTNISHSLYRVIIRTSELNVMRGCVLEEAIPSLSRISSPRGIHAKEVLEYVAPELQLSCLRLGTPSSEEKLLKLDEQMFTKTYKVGIMYCKANQTTEEEMYNNEHPGPALEEFLDMLGKRVRLKGFNKYKAGLDNRTDTTGLYSIYSSYNDCEVMFHVSTMLPFTPNNTQQLLRKRHIGNDIVTIVFQEPDSLPFTPKCIRSQFQHVFIVVRAINPCTDSTKYSIAVSRSKDVTIFGPAIPEGAVFNKSKALADFILAKAINAENEAHHSDKFTMMAQRTRQEYLKDLAENYVTSTTIDSGPKFSILSFGGRKKERPRLRFIPDTYVQGAIAWNVLVEDFGQSTVVDCVLGISIDTVVIIEENTKEIIFVCPCSGVIGWSSNTNSIKIFYHQGECVVLHTKDPDVDEVQEIVGRLSHVTQGCETQELILRRNSLGQLGFHVQYEGVVTEVESYGFAFQAGLRQGSRLVEICKVAASTLSYDQMVDLLKTSMTVTVTVIPPFIDGLPRKGCTLQHCSYLSSNSVGDYENVNGIDERSKKSSRSSSAGQKPKSSSYRNGGWSNPSNSRNDNLSSGTQNLPINNIDKSEKKLMKGNEKPRNRYVQDSRNLEQDHLHSHNLPITSNREHTALSAVLNGRNIGNSYSQASSSTVNSTPALSRSSIQSQPHQTRSSPSTPYSHLGTPPPPPPPPLHHNHAHHRSFHDHHNIIGRNLRLNGQLTHFGGLVASRSELSLNELSPLLTHNVGNGRSHAHRGIGNSTGIATRNPPDYNYARNSGNNNGKTQPSWSPLIIGEPAKDKEQPKSLPSVAPSTYSDYYSDSSSEWQPGANSADELSGDYCNTPPRITRIHHNHTTSSTSRPHEEPKNNPTVTCSTSSPSATPVSLRGTPRPEIRSLQMSSKQPIMRLRANGVSNHGGNGIRVPKSNGPYGTGTSSTSSCSGSSSSTLQEDLLKLISPDFLDSDSNSEGRISSRTEMIPSEGDLSTQTRSSTPYSSLDRSESGGSELNTSTPRKSSIGSANAPVILTKAQPAQVISSSEPSSPSPVESPLSREERLSPRVTSDRFLNKLKPLPPPPPASPLPFNQSPNADKSPSDWISMVDTATKAMAIGLRLSKPPWLDELSEKLKHEISKANGFPTRQIVELQNKVWILQQSLATEQHQKSNLEIEIHQLRQENQRLQEESQSASAQLRKFTQWFLQSMDS